ncbi:Lysophospholipase, alpha-beta hydrolase superfamily [Streptomyces sp. DvalAA-14]|uniref:alpha/beta hydrolase n=1 Tax=unclassified Streptomyces TaxID=2593676 RepID=UPI00081B0ADE|nr:MULTISPECIES: alpha/beta fold hydrolase [unclassified Streptomyces]SCD62045.1 Lysophospholipase, alpha-beta hydrolase superfamily [Streptomyces sp. DvalAA-14]
MSEQSVAPPATIVLIHGLWMSPHSWQPWIDRFTAEGHTVHAPAWPGVSELDQPLDHDRAPAEIGVTELVDHYDAFIRGLPESPVVIGHSFGGLIVQLLLDRGLCTVGVALHPAQPRGVLRLPLAALRSSFPVLSNPANRKRAVALNDSQFHYAFANTVSAEQAAEERARLAIPGPGRPLFEAALANFTPKGRSATEVDFTNGDRSPLLLVSGTEDHVVPAAVVHENFTKFGRSKALTEYKAYQGRDHGTAFHEGWEDVADYALSWALAHRSSAGEAGGPLTAEEPVTPAPAAPVDPPAPAAPAAPPVASAGPTAPEPSVDPAPPVSPAPPVTPEDPTDPEPPAGPKSAPGE